MSPLRCCSSFVVFIVLFSVVASASNDPNLDARLRSMFLDKTVMFLVPYPGHALRFRADGKPEFHRSPRSWLANSLFTIRKVKLTPDRLQLDGERELMLYDDDQHSMFPVPLGEKLKVTIDLDPSQPPEPQIALAVRKLLYGANVNDFLANYWKPALRGEHVDANLWRKEHPGAPAGILGSRPVYYVERGLVKPPRALKTPDPQYAEGARQNRFQGRVVLFVIINEQGDPELLEVARRLGQGLDLKALEAVSGWKFAPAIRYGKPVPVAINVEVNFKVY